jgi:hypothetical protein
MTALAALPTTHAFPHAKFTDSKSELEKLSCQLCYDIPKQANLFPCCQIKLVCRGCVESTFRVKSECPFCRTHQQQTILNQFVQNMIKELTAKCSHNGCEHTALLENMLHHEEKLCVFRNVHCDFCNNPFAFNKLAEHKEICELKPMPCKHCKLKFQPTQMINHLQLQCEGFDRQCPDGCGAMIKLPEFRIHERDCPKHKVPCSWADHGCRELVPRENLAAHDANIKDHITRAVAHATSAARPSYTSLQQIAWPPSYDMLMSLTGEYFVPNHPHALKVTSRLYLVNPRGEVKRNSCNVRGSGCTGHIEFVPGIPQQDSRGWFHYFGARCECCDFDACIRCLITQQTLPTREQLIAMEQKYKSVPQQMSQDLTQARNKIDQLTAQVDQQSRQIALILASFESRYQYHPPAEDLVERRP